jgi:Fe-S-cluster containining protein
MKPKANFRYPRNIRFKCSNCGICCGDTAEKTRHILLTERDAERIAASTKQAVNAFANKAEGKAPYTHEMRKRAENGKCVFHQNSRCTIYPLRPLICKFYPFELSAAEHGTHTFTVTNECPKISSSGTAEEGEKLGWRHFQALFKLARAELAFERDFPANPS